MFILLVLGTIILLVVQVILIRKGKVFTGLLLAIYYSILSILHFQLYMVFINFVLWMLVMIGLLINKNTEVKNNTKGVAIILGLFLTLHIIGFGYNYLNSVVTEGYFTIEDHNILEENGKYYLFLEEQKIEVTEEIFNRVHVNEQYHIRYSWNKLSNNNGKIEEINLDSLSNE